MKLKTAPSVLGNAPSALGFATHDEQRGSARKRGYDSRWDRRAMAYKRANPLCLGCQAVGRYEATEVADHTIPHKGNRRLFDDPDNLQPSCKWHHDVVKQKLELMWLGGEIDDHELRLDSETAKGLTTRLQG